MNLARSEELGKRDSAINLLYTQFSTPRREPRRRQLPEPADETSDAGAAAPAPQPQPPQPALTWREGACLDCATWMSALGDAIADRPLQSLRLPGTHDSGAYSLSRRHMAPSALPRALVRLNRAAPWATAPVGGLVARWGEAQGGDVGSQLAAGARYLDLRLVRRGTEFHLAHGMLGPSAGDVLAQVASFLAACPGEAVVLDLNHFHKFRGRADHAAFLQLLGQARSRATCLRDSPNLQDPDPPAGSHVAPAPPGAGLPPRSAEPALRRRQRVAAHAALRRAEGYRPLRRSGLRGRGGGRGGGGLLAADRPRDSVPLAARAVPGDAGAQAGGAGGGARANPRVFGAAGGGDPQPAARGSWAAPPAVQARGPGLARFARWLNPHRSTRASQPAPNPLSTGAACWTWPGR